MLPSASPRIERDGDGPTASANRPTPAWDGRPRRRPRDNEISTTQLVETIERAPFSLFAPIGLTALLTPFFWGTPDQFDVLCVFGTLGVLEVLVLIACRSFMLNAGSTEIGNQGAAVFAVLIGATWAALPILLYPTADSGQRLMLVAALCGAIGNVCLVGPAWPVSLAYVMPLIGGGVLGLAAGRDPASLTLAVLLLVAGGVIGFVLDHNRKRTSGHILADLEVDDHAFTIDRLLLDFQDTDDDWLWETDAHARLGHVAPRMAKSAGASASDLEGATFNTILKTTSRRSATSDGASSLLDAMKTREPFRNQVVAIDTSNGAVWWRLSGRPIVDRDGKFAGFRGIGTDITASRNAETRVAYFADHDAGTGLRNRLSFHDHARRECAATAQGGRGGALLSLDLDGFKAINARLGHAAGDEILQEVARRLTSLAPADTVTARIGGDEFAIWCPTTIPAKAIALAGDITKAIGTSIILRSGAQVDIGACVGIALTPKHGTDSDLLLARADLALLQAKADGNGLTRLFIEEYEHAILDKRTLEVDLRLALARQEFELYFQPILDVATGRVDCFETLIRWTSPTRGFVSPVDFIPAAESAGLVVAIDRWVLQHACKAATTWPENVHVAVNVSPNHFRGTDLLQDVQAALRLSGLNPDRLEIEVTEGVFLGTSTTAVETLLALRRLGVKIAIDDFGTGYSSLSYLINFPIDKIKIDRAFIRAFIDRRESRAIVDAILTLARKLSIRVVAEGVETREQALALKLRQCGQIQGYLLSQPKPGHAVLGLIATVPELYRAAVPVHVDTALGMALAMKKQTA